MVARTGNCQGESSVQLRVGDLIVVVDAGGGLSLTRHKEDAVVAIPLDEVDALIAALIKAATLAERRIR